MAIKTITIILGIVFFGQVILRIIKKVFSFSIPLYGGYLLDCSLRKGLQSPNGVINRSGLKKDMKILEVGCGIGRIFFDLIYLVCALQEISNKAKALREINAGGLGFLILDKRKFNNVY